MEIRRGSLVFVSIVAFAIAALPITTHGQTAADPEIIVIGEVQGAANTVAAFLEHLDLIDSEHHWSGGDTILIQTGDLIDDGEHVRAALDLFMGLQEEAAAAGGRVIVLMGNHEALNILGELRDVNPMAYKSFAGPDSENRQNRAWEDWSAWSARRAEAVGETTEVDAEAEEVWYASHPPGWVEYAESMGPDGVYGSWLRSLPVAVEINDVLFVHGGVHQEIEDREVASINRRAIEEIKSFDGHKALMVAEASVCPPPRPAKWSTSSTRKRPISTASTTPSARRPILASRDCSRSTTSASGSPGRCSTARVRSVFAAPQGGPRKSTVRRWRRSSRRLMSSGWSRDSRTAGTVLSRHGSTIAFC